MIDQLEISRQEYLEMVYKYVRIRADMPKELQMALPLFANFLSPAKLTDFNRNSDTYGLSITGAKRWEMIKSPHAATLLCAYAIQKLDHANDLYDQA